MAITIETLRNGDEQAGFNLGQQVFGGRDQYRPDPIQPPNEHWVVAYDGETIVGRLKIHQYQQWFGGRAQAMGGIGGVAVAPEARGKGIAGRLLGEAIERMGDAGQAISVLFPSTATLYRSFGWEFAGRYSWAQIGSVDANLGGSPNAVRLDSDDTRIRVLYDLAAAARDGWLDRNDYSWASIWESFHDTPMPSQLVGIERSSNLVAVVGYSYSAPSDEPFDLNVRIFFALDGAAMADALTFLSRHETMVAKINLLYPAKELQLSIAQGQRVIEHRHEPWMLRLINTTAAVESRGFPTGIATTVHLEILDDQQEQNAGRFVLSVQDGRGSLDAGGTGTVSVRVSDLASLFSGYADPGFLANAGRLAGAEPRDIEALRLTFAGPDPTLVNYF